MAQQKKKAKGNAKKAPWRGVALYNLDDSSEKGSRVRKVLEELDCPIRTITPNHLASPVGSVAGLPGFKPSNKPYGEDLPSEEFMLICGLSSQQIDTLLAALRESDAAIPHKAQVTQFNKMWPFATLINEIAKEHAALSLQHPTEG